MCRSAIALNINTKGFRSQCKRDAETCGTRAWRNGIRAALICGGE
jgi:hypothetical protein